MVLHLDQLIALLKTWKYLLRLNHPSFGSEAWPFSEGPKNLSHITEKYFQRFVEKKMSATPEEIAEFKDTMGQV